MLKKTLLLLTACMVTPLVCGGNKHSKHLQAAPLLTTAQRKDLQTVVSGTLKSKAHTAFLIQFFNNLKNGTTTDGALFLEQITVKTNAKGQAHFKACLPCTNVGTFVSATATRLNKDEFAGTSEFSTNVEVVNS